jgi:hypothetical protein
MAAGILVGRVERVSLPDWSFPPPESRRSPAVPREGSDVILVRWDEKLGVALISHPAGLALGTIEEVELWREELFRKLALIEKARGGRFPIVVSVDGLTIRPSVAEPYGRVVSTYTERFASGLARFVNRPNGVGQIITVAAMKGGYRANLFTSRGDAIAHALAEANGSRSRPGG